MKAVVTGATGFVGHWLLEHLRAAGDDVVAWGLEVEIVDGDAVRAALHEAEPEVVYHLAGQAHVGQSWDAPVVTFSVNALGTVNLLAAAQLCSPPPRVLVVSSAEVYGRVTPEELPLTEASPLRPLSPYAASKVAAEFCAYQAAMGSGLPTVVVRAFNHIGPGQSPNFAVSALAKRVVEAERSGASVLRLGNTTPRRDLTDVRDVVRAYRLLMERGEPGAIYNVCSGRDVMIGDVAKRLVELAGLSLRIETDPALVRPVDIPVLCGDNTRLRDVTGWEPRWDLDDSLRSVLDYWRANLPAS